MKFTKLFVYFVLINFCFIIQSMHNRAPSASMYHEGRYIKRKISRKTKERETFENKKKLHLRIKEVTEPNYPLLIAGIGLLTATTVKTISDVFRSYSNPNTVTHVDAIGDVAGFGLGYCLVYNSFCSTKKN